MCAQREHAAAQVLLNSMRADLLGATTCQTDPPNLRTSGSLERGRKSVGSDPGLQQQAAALAGVRPCRAADRF